MCCSLANSPKRAHRYWARLHLYCYRWTPPKTSQQHQPASIEDSQSYAGPHSTQLDSKLKLHGPSTGANKIKVGCGVSLTACALARTADGQFYYGVFLSCCRGPSSPLYYVTTTFHNLGTKRIELLLIGIRRFSKTGNRLGA